MADAVGIDKEKPNKPLTVAVKMLKGWCGVAVQLRRVLATKRWPAPPLPQTTPQTKTCPTWCPKWR